jgi:hypothetical protein
MIETSILASGFLSYMKNRPAKVIATFPKTWDIRGGPYKNAPTHRTPCIGILIHVRRSYKGVD